MKIRLPEKKFFTVEELAARWEVSVSDIEHLLDTGELFRADKLAALAGKRNTSIKAYKQNPFASFPSDFVPADISGFIDWESGTRVLFGLHDKGTFTHRLMAYDQRLGVGETTDRDIYSEVLEAFPKALETVVLIEDVLAFESKYAEQERTETINGEHHSNRSDFLMYLNQASTIHWGRVDRNDKATHPVNSKIEDWLKDKGFSPNLAKSGASIIRPEWAAKGAPTRE